MKRLRRKLNYLEHSADVDMSIKEGKKRRKRVTNGIRNQKKIRAKCSVYQTLKSEGKVAKEIKLDEKM